MQAVLTARLLGAEGYGIVAVAMAVVSIAATVCVFGFGSLSVREIPARLATGDAAGTAAFLRHAFTVVLALSAAAAIGLELAMGATKWIDSAYRRVLEIGALLIVPFALIALFRGMSQGFGRIPLAQVPGEIVRPAVMVLLMGVAVLLGLRFEPLDFMWSYLAAATLVALAGGAWLWRSELAILPPPAASKPRRHFAAALPFLALGLTGLLEGEINTLMLGWLIGPHETGLFQPIVRLTPVLALPIVAADMRFAPRVSELWHSGQLERLRAVTATFTWTTTLLTLAISFSAALAGPWLMGIFGSEFRPSAPLLWIVAAAQVLNAVSGPGGVLLTMIGRSGSALVGKFAGLAVNLAIGALLIPTRGALGAAIAIGSGIVVWNACFVVMAVVHCGFDPTLVGSLRSIAKPRKR